MPPPLLELLPRRPLLMLAPEEDKEDDDPRILSEAAVGEEPVRSSVRPRAGFPTPDIWNCAGTIWEGCAGRARLSRAYVSRSRGKQGHRPWRWRRGRHGRAVAAC
jgi:hypothetical protein